MAQYTQEPTFVLAPMDGMTRASFRSICFDYGADGATTEMIQSLALGRAKKRLSEPFAETMVRYPDERNLAAQLIGSVPAMMAESARRLTAMNRFDAIDINMGCPARTVVGSGVGAAGAGVTGGSVATGAAGTGVGAGVTGVSAWVAAGAAKGVVTGCAVAAITSLVGSTAGLPLALLSRLDRKVNTTAAMRIKTMINKTAVNFPFIAGHSFPWDDFIIA